MNNEQRLRDFHANHAGASAFVFGNPNASGPGISYRRLADALDGASVQGPVLDLACGDGPLLELLVRRGIEVVGLDMSPEELALARKRLGNGVRLEEANAASMPFDDAWFGAALSHMAFMLMAPIEPVVDELARVLRPGARFAATVGRRCAATPSVKRFWTKFNAVYDAHAPAGSEFERLGDERVGESDSLRSLFDADRWRDFDEETYAFEVLVPADQLEHWFTRAFYHVAWLPLAGREELFAWIAAERDALAPDGVMPWSFAVRQFSVVRV